MSKLTKHNKSKLYF